MCTGMNPDLNFASADRFNLDRQAYGAFLNVVKTHILFRPSACHVDHKIILTLACFLCICPLRVQYNDIYGVYN